MAKKKKDLEPELESEEVLEEEELNETENSDDSETVVVIASERKAIKAELKRCYSALASLDPKSAEYEKMQQKIKTLKSLKNESKFTKIDSTSLIKTGAVVLLVVATEVIELPGNIVNLKAIKAIQPVVQWLKL